MLGKAWTRDVVKSNCLCKASPTSMGGAMALQLLARIRIRIRIVTRSRGRRLLEPSRLMGHGLVASALCDRDSRGHCSPFKAGVHKGPECMLVRTAHKGAHAGMCKQERGHPSIIALPRIEAKTCMHPASLSVRSQFNSPTLAHCPWRTTPGSPPTPSPPHAPPPLYLLPQAAAP
jgi:hypothetical protein